MQNAVSCHAMFFFPSQTEVDSFPSLNSDIKVFSTMFFTWGSNIFIGQKQKRRVN